MGERPLLVGVGGFLGAGKTTAIVAAVRRLREAGRRVAVITNDQASGLVDTAVARAALAEGQVVEIAGGCFCCRYDDLVGVLEEVIARAEPEVILAEAVGSCTDLAATVYQPLRQLEEPRIPVRLGPLTVVADGTRLQSVARFGALPRLSSDVNYLFGQQLAEADVLLLNKTDQMGEEEVGMVRRWLEGQYAGVPVLPVSALSGEGMERWIAALVEWGDAGRRVLDLDYDRYAAAEAEMGWLNLHGTVRFETGGGAAAWVRAVLSGLARRVSEGEAEVAHVKILLEAGGGACRGHLTGTDARPFVVVNGSVMGEGRVTLNARVTAAPARLRGWVEGAMAEANAAAGVQTAVSEVQCFAPARPVPTHRLQPVAMA